ncbi:MAG: right-handed parallel beta-helix repeat-containing protein [Deltaproteobacteria bacterium]|nr:right-handed parallel beta-helix repeat-containing protein [Deltaproteobacteria bacterium]
MRTIVVHPTDESADAHSLTQAFTMAKTDDVVLVGPGVYSPTRTHETLPLTVPAGVAVEGVDQEACVIDGEGQFEPSFNPIRPDMSVVQLFDGTSMSGLTVTNGGGHGIGVPLGASVVIRNCTIGQHGDHGVYVSGATEAFVSGCRFQHNGLKRFEPSLPRGVGARQGHHIFAEAKHGQRNRLVATDNVMRGCFADGIAFICFFPEPDEVSFSATILRNTIEDSERGGLLFSCSFGPARNRYRILAADNVLRGNKQMGASILAAIPLAERVPHHNLVNAVFAGNAISGSSIGILVQGAVGETHQNECHVTIDRNRISSCAKNAIRLVGGVGIAGVTTNDNALHAVVSRNFVAGSIPAIVAQGAGGAGSLQQNAVHVRFLDNHVEAPQEQSLLVCDGAPDNRVEVAADSQAYLRTEGNFL